MAGEAFANCAVFMVAVRAARGVARRLRGACIPRFRAFRPAAFGKQTVGDRAIGGVFRDGARADPAIGIGGGTWCGPWIYRSADWEPDPLHAVPYDVQRSRVCDISVAGVRQAA